MNPKITFEKNNTEGHHTTAVKIENSEIKKNDKIVATDLPDLYDVEITNPQEDEVLKYDNTTQLWKNGTIQATVPACENIPVDTIYKIGGANPDFVDFEHAFKTLNNNCTSIQNDKTVTLQLEENLNHTSVIDEYNFNYGYRVEIDGNNHQILINHTHREIKQIINSNDFIFILKADGTLWSIGRNTYGQLGLGDTIDRNTLTQVGTDTDWKYISCGENHTLALKTNGRVYGCGRNNVGQLTGSGDRHSFVQIGSQNNWINVLATGDCSYFHNDNKLLFACGNNIQGQFGIGDNSNKNSLTQIWEDITLFSAGPEHLVVYHGLSLHSSGSNSDGRLGLNDTTDRNILTYMVFTQNVKKIKCTRFSTFIITTSGELYSCGGNSSYQLGFNHNSNVLTLTQVSLSFNVIDIDGYEHTIILNENNELWGCGKNDTYQLGITGGILFIFIKNDIQFFSCGNQSTILLNSYNDFYRTGNTPFGNSEEFIYNDTFQRHDYDIRISNNQSIKKIKNLSLYNNLSHPSSDGVSSNKPTPVIYNTLSDSNIEKVGMDGSVLYNNKIYCIPRTNDPFFNDYTNGEYYDIATDTWYPWNFDNTNLNGTDWIKGKICSNQDGIFIVKVYYSVARTATTCGEILKYNFTYNRWDHYDYIYLPVTTPSGSNNDTCKISYAIGDDNFIIFRVDRRTDAILSTPTTVYYYETIIKYNTSYMTNLILYSNNLSFLYDNRYYNYYTEYNVMLFIEGGYLYMLNGIRYIHPNMTVDFLYFRRLLIDGSGSIEILDNTYFSDSVPYLYVKNGKVYITQTYEETNDQQRNYTKRYYYNNQLTLNRSFYIFDSTELTDYTIIKLYVVPDKSNDVIYIVGGYKFKTVGYVTTYSYFHTTLKHYPLEDYQIERKRSLYYKIENKNFFINNGSTITFENINNISPDTSNLSYHKELLEDEYYVYYDFNFFNIWLNNNSKANVINCKLNAYIVENKSLLIKDENHTDFYNTDPLYRINDSTLIFNHNPIIELNVENYNNSKIIIKDEP